VPDHPIKLSDQEKVDWFKRQIEERQRTNPLENELQLVDFVRTCRKMFKEVYKRDVPGSFIRRLLNDLGVAREHSEGVKRKRDYMFNLMDTNQSFRENKTQLRKAVEDHFKECILAMVFDELWEEYHGQAEHPAPDVDVDLYGQEALFPE